MPDFDSEYDKGLVLIKHWLWKQPHLPHDVDDLLLRRFVLSCGNSLERAKRAIDLFFTIRSNAPEIFTKRDPFAADIRRVFEITDMLPLPNRTKENYKVFIYRLNNPNLDLFNFTDAVKTFFMLADTRLTGDLELSAGEVPIFDAAKISVKFVSKINLSVLRKYMLYTQEAIPIRLKQVHIINVPAYIGKLYAVVKPFLKSEVAKLIQFHEPDSETLYDSVPQELLPGEYGGKAGSLQEIKQYWIKQMENKRDWFLDDSRWAVDETRRPTGNSDDRIDTVRDLPGSFRSLELD